MNIAILGSTGNVGSAVSAELKRRGVFHFNANRKNFDFLNPATFRPFLKGMRRLFLMVPLSPHVEEITGEIVSAAAKEGVEKVVKLSAWGASATAPARIHRLHFGADEIVARSGISFSLLRPNSFLQNFVKFHGPGVRRAGVLAAPAGEALVSFVDARDVAQVAAHELLAEDTPNGSTAGAANSAGGAFKGLLNPPTNSGRCLEITGPKAQSFSDAARILTQLTGRGISYIAVTDDQAREKWEKAGLPEWHREALAELFGTYRRNEAARLTTVLNDVTGSFGTTLETYLTENQEAFHAPV